LTLNGFTRTGYSFLGWNTNYNAGTASYLDGQNYAFTSSTSLYAIWVLQAVNQVTFNGNSSTSGTTDSQTASVNTVLNSNGFLRTGYTFLRWNTAANGTGVNYSPGYSYSFATSVTLYAIWGQNLTISYDGNTSTGGTVPTSQAYYVGGPNLTVSENTGSLAKTGYTLAGWNTAANGSGTSYALGALNATFASNTTLYAQWTGATYTLLYVGNANTSGAAPSSQSYVSGGTALTIAGNSGTLAKRWHNFIGWNSAANGSGTNYTIGDSTVVIAADTILYAKWLRTSLYGVEEADLTELQSWNASTSSVTTTVSNPSNTSSASITFPGSSLPSGTTIKLWELANSNVARAKIDASKDYLVNIVLSWAKADGTIPDAVSAITIVIRNSSIKKGAIGYQIIGDAVTQIGTSSADGELTLSITQDPIIAIANVPVQNNNSGGGGGGGGGGAPIVIVPEPTESKPVEVVKPVVEIPQNRITSFTKTTKVYFGLNASWINSENIKNIRAFLAGVSKTGNIKEVTIQGFTQPTRINPDPLKLSVARAKAVGKFVKSQGVVSRVITQGKGNAKNNNANSRYVLLTVTGELIGN
jgi:outer membrane protein OmpA-like peptidoglycan-associated protein